MPGRNRNITKDDQGSTGTELVVHDADVVEATTAPGHPGHVVEILRDDLDAVMSWEDAIALLTAHGVTPMDAADVLADDFLATAKDDLINVPFIVMEVKHSYGDYGMFSTCRVMTRDGRRLRFSDGSTGIFEQLQMLKRKYNVDGVGLTCWKGLTKSTYTRRDGEGKPVLDEKGNEQKGTTFYFSTQTDVTQSVSAATT